MGQRMRECLEDIRTSGITCHYYINELRYAIQAGYVDISFGMIWKEGQPAKLTPFGQDMLRIWA